MTKFQLKRAQRAHAEEFRHYIPFMPPEQKAVIAQLLHENHKSFDGADDGGYAAPLIGQGFIVVNAVRGQTLDLERVPYSVPDHIWEVAVAHKEAFPYKPNPRGGDAWRVALDGAVAAGLILELGIELDIAFSRLFTNRLGPNDYVSAMKRSC